MAARKVELDALMTTDDLCAYLMIDRRTLERMHVRGDAPRRRKVGGTWRYLATDVDRWLRQDAA